MEQDEKEFLIQIGEKIRFLRSRSKISQQTLANYLNITFQQVQKYEKGSNSASFFKLIQICLFFNVPITYFLTKEQYDQIQGDSVIESIATGIKNIDIQKVKIFLESIKESK